MAPITIGDDNNKVPSSKIVSDSNEKSVAVPSPPPPPPSVPTTNAPSCIRVADAAVAVVATTAAVYSR